jgi:hypothetical protein
MPNVRLSKPPRTRIDPLPLVNPSRLETFKLGKADVEPIGALRFHPNDSKRIFKTLAELAEISHRLGESE